MQGEKTLAEEEVSDNKKRKIFDDRPIFYYLQAMKFIHAAHRLEEVANWGDDSWQTNMENLVDAREGVIKIEPSPEHDLVIADRNCRHISAYLFSHGLELLLKALNIHIYASVKPVHKISELYEKIRPHFDSIPLTSLEIDGLLKKLDEIAIWAGRYPSPNENKYYGSAVETMSFTNRGYTSDIVVSLSDDPHMPLGNLKILIRYVLRKANTLLIA